jgi:hypothetical protein
MTDHPPEPPDSLKVFTIPEIQTVVRCGRHTARKIANEIGIRISPRRIVVPKVRLEAWLREGR